MPHRRPRPWRRAARRPARCAFRLLVGSSALLLGGLVGLACDPDAVPPATETFEIPHAGSQDTAALPDAPPPDDPSVEPFDPAPVPLIEFTVPDDALAALDAPADALEEPRVHAEVEMLNRRWADVRLQLHGATARLHPKRSYRLTFPDDDEPLVPWFDGPPDRHRRLVLHASWIDPTFLRNALTMDRARALGTLAPRVTHAWLRINGRDQGLYVVIERIDRPFLRRHGLDPDGQVLKAVDHRADWAAKPYPLLGFEAKVNPLASPAALGTLLTALSHTPPSAQAFEAQVTPRLELGEFMGWQLVHTFADNRDTFSKNYYLYHDASAPPGDPRARFRVISWDADATFGLTWNGTPVEPAGDRWHGTDAFVPRLLSIPTYRDAYLARFGAALDGVLSTTALAHDVALAAARIGPAARQDQRLWLRDGAFDVEVARLLAVIEARHTQLRQLLEGLKATARPR